MSCQLFEQGKIAFRTLMEIEEFRFPFSTPYEDRIQELELDRLYHDRSTYILSYQDGKLAGTVRIISKESCEEKLPIEYARLESGEFFQLPLRNYACEIGGLKIDESLPLKTRYLILNELLTMCANQIVIAGLIPFISHVKRTWQNSIRKKCLSKFWFLFFTVLKNLRLYLVQPHSMEPPGWFPKKGSQYVKKSSFARGMLFVGPLRLQLHLFSPNDGKRCSGNQPPGLCR